MANTFALFSKLLRKEIQRAGWKEATEIQKLAFPVILRGENALLIAPTGTGKTEAACLPVFELFIRERSKSIPRGISILYVTPLRALNRDIFRRLIEIGRRLGIEVQVRHGDTATGVRRMQALKPPNMLITTPETLQAILPGKRMQKHLSSVRWVIVDEIHELATDKRGAQLSIGLERLREITSTEFQRIGLSATIGSPELIAHFLAGSRRKATVIKAYKSKEWKVVVESPTATAEDETLGKKFLISAGSVCRIRRLFDLVNEHKSTLIFTNTREHAEALASRIRVLKPSLRIGIHHGSLSRDARVETEKEFREGTLQGVVCTSSLELGIDVGSVDFVAQYLSPRQVAKLVQRVGRSGHAIGAKPSGCILAAWPDDVLEAAVIAKLALEEKLELPKIHENALDVLAHQIVGMVLDRRRIAISDAYDVVTRAWPYSTLQSEEFMNIVKQLEREGLIRLNGEATSPKQVKTYRYYFTNLSMIPDVRQYQVFDFIRRRKMGILDQEFVGKNGRPGAEFIMHGQTWRILNLDEEREVIEVEPVDQSLGAIPSWEGEIIPVPFEVAQTVGRLREKIAENLITKMDPLEPFKEYPVDPHAAYKVITTIKKHIEAGFKLPTHNQVVIECFENYAIIHACFGNLVNETLSRILGTVLGARWGTIIGVQADPYRIAVIAPHHLDPEILQRELLELKSEEVATILFETLGDTSLFMWHFWHVAKRFGIVERGADYKSSRARALVRILRDTPLYRETLRELITEKLDLETTQKVVKEIHDSAIKIEVTPYCVECSPLALPLLDKIAPHDLLRPAVPVKAVLEVIKERLDSETVRLVCVFCGNYDGVRVVRALPDRIRCPICKSTLLAVTYGDDVELRKIVCKKIRKHELTREEEQKWLTAWKSASLIQTYGKKAAITLSGRGVGPTTAVRILRRPHKTDEEFYMNIVRAEREYARTRMFWDR